MAKKRALSDAASSSKANKKNKSFDKSSYKSVNRNLNRNAIVRNVPLRNVNLGPGFPQKLTSTLRYVFKTTFNNVVPAAIQSNSYSCNGIYSIGGGGTAHQPMYFDQFMALYDQFTVIMSRLKVTFTNVSANPVYCGVFLNDDTSITATTYAGVSEQTGAKHIIVGARDSGTSTRSLTEWWGVRKWFGNAPLANDNLRGTASSNPAEQTYFTVWTQPVDEASASTVYIDFEFEYTTVFTELKDIASS